MTFKYLTLLKNLWNDSLQKIRHLLLRLIYLALKSHKKKNTYPKHVKKILLIRRNRLGDAINLLPIIHALKKNYPSVKINVLANKYNAQIFQYSNQIENIYILNENSWLGQNFLFLNPIIRKLKKENFDLVIALGGYTSKLAKITYSLKPKYSVGMGSNKFFFDLFYDKAIIFDKKYSKSHLEEMSILIRESGLLLPKKLPYTNLGFSNSSNKKWLAICPEARREISKYPVKHYGKIIQDLLKSGKFKKINFFTVDPKSEYSGLASFGAINIQPKNLDQFITQLAKYKYVITAGGGSAHIAGALGLSVCVISGEVTEGGYWKPHAKNVRTIVNPGSIEMIDPETIIQTILSLNENG